MASARDNDVRTAGSSSTMSMRACSAISEPSHVKAKIMRRIAGEEETIDGAQREPAQAGGGGDGGPGDGGPRDTGADDPAALMAAQSRKLRNSVIGLAVFFALVAALLLGVPGLRSAAGRISDANPV